MAFGEKDTRRSIAAQDSGWISTKFWRRSPPSCFPSSSPHWWQTWTCSSGPWPNSLTSTLTKVCRLWSTSWKSRPLAQMVIDLTRSQSPKEISEESSNSTLKYYQS